MVQIIKGFLSCNDQGTQIFYPTVAKLQDSDEKDNIDSCYDHYHIDPVCTENVDENEAESEDQKKEENVNEKEAGEDSGDNDINKDKANCKEEKDKGFSSFCSNVCEDLFSVEGVTKLERKYKDTLENSLNSIISELSLDNQLQNSKSKKNYDKKYSE